jgi:pimeloyl-ACP methyl ester carboxylesterase
MMRGLTWLALAGGLGACGDSHTTTLKCSGGAQGTLATGQAVTVAGGDDLEGAAIAAEAHTTVPASAVSIACAAADIAPAGFTPLGPAVTFGDEGTWSDRPFLLTLPYKAARLPDGASRGNVRIVAKRATGEAFFPPLSNRAITDNDAYASRITFRAGELTTYQVVAADDAGTAQAEDFGFNAIIGISMGGNAAMSIALRHPDKFDAFADLGGEPGPSMVYTLSMVSDSLFGGFCTAEDEAAGRGMVGQLCPHHSTRKDEHEIEADYEHMVYQAGDGVGLTLKRSLYMKASRDLGRALGNPALYNAMDPYAPPGVPASYFTQTAAQRCANPIVLGDFFDREFNPDGTKPVITFCDGGDSTALGLAVFDPTLPQNDPAELLLAVDLNGNGKRDAGEPVITNAYEPFKDVGSDGKADADEPGYDAVTNPDPAGDDFHWQRNPRGTENNKTFDEGEPYEDVGLDGVASTCQAGAVPPSGVGGCYDFGEGNGKWDLSPNVARWYESDLNVRLAKLTAEQRRHMAMWFDAGIRDFLNASVSTNTAIGRAMGDYQLPFAVWDGFSPINGKAIEQDPSFDFEEIPWADLPKNNYLRYGNPDASADEIMRGDGRHVGTANQAIYRFETALAWIDKHLPDGDRDDSNDGGIIMKDLTFTSPTTGRVSPFALFLPPGYGDPANASRRYPVVYVLHGYGMEPQDLVTLSSVIANHMIASAPLETRIQKFIMVYVDGRCRPEQSGVPVPAGGDGCEGGTFYMDSPLGGTARMETNLVDLQAHIDATYRTKPRASVQVKAD